MRMSFWMDYASPFCYIAFHKLTEAVKAVGLDQNKLDYNSKQTPFSFWECFCFLCIVFFQ